ncbi:MAG TPA: LssY C-terminal domain-containing protein [Pirellulales bacterium]|nr:LssY C-terminal domain-containing protein [Pirellulales bacterium]
MALDRIPLLRWLTVPYHPDATARQFLQRAQTQSADGLEASVAVLDGAESKQFFGVSLARRGIQPVWLRIVNRSPRAYRLNLLGLDPNYFSPYEAAAINRFVSGRRILEFGFFAWIFLPLLMLPLLILLPIKLIAARRANRRMEAFFEEHAFHLRPIGTECTAEGFVFTSLDAGSKIVHLRFMSHEEVKEFTFTVPVPGLHVDYLRHDFENRYAADQIVECTIPMLVERISQMPPTTTNAAGSRHGDPVNLVVAGEFPTIISAFAARWDETETITMATCWKTFRAFFMGSEYRYSPVSPLYLFGRSQDFALQRVRRSINERLHLRLWATTLRFEGVPVWIGQVSRDIGVRFTWRTWNLTTHRIDPDVDEARDYVVEDLLQAERLEKAGYLDGVGACGRQSPRLNLTGDVYFTDGRRAAVMVSASRTAPQFVAWA